MIIRVLSAVFLLVSIIFLPFWVSFIVALVAMIYFSFFAEAIFLFLLSDLFYGVKEEKFYGIFFVSFIISTFMLIVIEIIKRKVRLYPKESK